MRISDWSSDVCSSDLAREKDAVDPARARARDDIGKDAQLDIAMLRDSREQIAIDAARSADRLAIMKGARGGGEPPYLLGDAVHIDGKEIGRAQRLNSSH